jgi:acyl phosphate:glycerol-3-phosphate acyltransferase
MVTVVIAVVISYLLGSIIGSLLLGRFRGVDIRDQGSGNAGGTNALRTQGKGFALGVIMIDIGKGVVAAGPVAGLAAAFSSGAVSLETAQVACGAAAVIGHVWPVFFQFRGGKGAATLVGVLLVVQPLALLAVLGVFALVLVASGFVGLSTMVATATTIAWAGLMVDGGVTAPFGVFAVLMTGFIMYTHRSNIQRMRAGNENRFRKAMLLHRRG